MTPVFIAAYAFVIVSLIVACVAVVFGLGFLFRQVAYSRDTFFARINQHLTTTTDLRHLLETTATEIATTLQAERVYFFIYHPAGRHITAGSDHRKMLPTSDAETIRASLNGSDKAIVTKSLKRVDPLRRLLVSHDLELVLPLVREQQLVGLLCLTHHTASRYSRRDITLLETLSDELLIAIENAMSIQEIRQLNATLQQRVDNATRELRSSNTQLRHLDEAKDEFVSMASHQLRTPLTSVKGYISMILEGDAGKISGDQEKLLSEAFNSSERMVRLINDFLSVSRLQTGKFIIDARPVDLAKIVSQELDSLQTSAASRDLKFAYTPPRKLPPLTLDEGKIRQVIMNYADNAIYYSHEKSTIRVTLAVKGKDVVFTVKDTGIGVPKAEQAKLFDKFFRATNARKQRPDGTGVGLFLAKKVVDAQGGSVIFESTEGKGSTFGFRFPLAKLVTSATTDDVNNLDNQNNHDGDNTGSNQNGA